MTATYDYFWHNWVSSCRVETRFRTEIVPSRDDGLEERVAAAERPYRSLTLRWTAKDAAEQSRIHFVLVRAAGQRTYVPIYPDQQITTATSNGTTINCPTASSRFAVGSEVLIVSANGVTRERKTIQSFTGAAITLTGALANAYAAGARVFPLILAEIQPDSGYAAYTRSAGEVDATFVEVFSSASIPAAADIDEPGALGADTSDANDMVPEAPVLSLAPDFVLPVATPISRPHDRADFGLGTIITPRGPRAAFGWEFNYLTTSKAAAADLHEFFDSRRGRLMPFYWVNPVIDWELAAIDVDQVDIVGVGNVADLQDALEYVAVVMKDGTTYIRKVASVGTSGANFVINLDVDLPVLSSGNVDRVTSAHFARFAKDALLQEARTDGVSVWRVSVVEVLGEAQALEITVPAGTVYDEDCAPVSESCLGNWTICYVAYMMDPRSISFDCSPCSIGFGFVQVTVAEEDECMKEITTLLGLWDHVSETIPSCGNPSVVGIPVLIQDTECEYVLAYAGDCTDIGLPACRPMQVYVSIKPGHVVPPTCACDGSIVNDARFEYGGVCPDFPVDGAWFGA